MSLNELGRSHILRSIEILMVSSPVFLGDHCVGLRYRALILKLLLSLRVIVFNVVVATLAYPLVNPYTLIDLFGLLRSNRPLLATSVSLALSGAFHPVRGQAIVDYVRNRP